MNIYMSGSLVDSIATFRNEQGVLADPTTTTLKYRAGVGATQTITGGSLTHVSTGVFSFSIDTTGWAGPGNILYTCQWTGVGNVQAIDADYFEVEPPAL